MDTFIEQLVTKQSSTKETLAKVGLVLAALLVAFLCITLPILLGAYSLGSIGLLLAAGAVYGGWYLISGMSVEYEYIVTNGEIDVDKIAAKRKRKRLVTVKAQNFEAFGLLTEAPAVGQGVTTIMAVGTGVEEYFADFNHAKLGQVRLIFSPNQRLLDSLRPFLPRTIRLPIQPK